MKKIIQVCLLCMITAPLSYAQTDISSEEADAFITLAEEKAEVLQVELSLTDEQKERVASKIYKYSVIAEELLQSNLDANDKIKELYTIAAEQKEEIRFILTEAQYNYYKRRNNAISARK